MDILCALPFAFLLASWLGWQLMLYPHAADFDFCKTALIGALLVRFGEVSAGAAAHKSKRARAVLLVVELVAALLLFAIFKWMSAHA